MNSYRVTFAALDGSSTILVHAWTIVEVLASFEPYVPKGCSLTVEAVS